MSEVSNPISSPAATVLLSWYVYLFVLMLYATLLAFVVLFLVNFGSVPSGHFTFFGVAVRILFIILHPSVSSLSHQYFTCSLSWPSPTILYRC